MKKSLFAMLFCGLLFFAQSASIEPGDSSKRHKADYETTWEANTSQEYRISAFASNCSFVDKKTEASDDAILLNDHSAAHATAKKSITHTDVPNTSAFGFSVFGVLAGSGKGSAVTWSATLQQKFFWLDPMEKIVPEGTNVTITANGSPAESTWSINNTAWKNHADSNSEPYKASSIILNRDMWDKMQWTPATIPAGWQCPTAGTYNISATTTEKSPDISRSASATVIVLGLKPLYYRIGDSGNFIAMEDYNDDGVYELIIPYYDQIISVGNELNGAGKNEIEIFIKASLQPSADVWPAGKPTWTGATIVSGDDRSIAKLTVNTNGTKTVEVKYDDSYKVSAKIHVIKVNYKKDADNKYGFDEPYKNHPLNDYNTYISLKNNGNTSVKVNLDPFPSDLDFYAKSSSGSKLKIGSIDEIKLSAASSTITLNGQSAGSANVSVYLKHKKTPSQNLPIADGLVAKIYEEKSFNISQFKIGTTTDLNKSTLNSNFKEIVYLVNEIHQESFPSTNLPDINNNSFVDYYTGDSNSPEINKITQGIQGKTNPIVLIKEIKTNYRATVTNIDTDNKRIDFQINVSNRTLPTSIQYSIFTENTNGTDRRILNSNIGILDDGDRRYSYSYTTTTLSVGDSITVMAESPITIGVSISSSGIIIATQDDGISITTVDKISLHELGHFIAGFSDTDYKKISDSVETTMQYNGAYSSIMLFSCRKVEKVQTNSGISYFPKQYQSHWDVAAR